MNDWDSLKLVVWCVMSSIGLRELFFFCNASSSMTTVTGEIYLMMLQKFAVPQLQARSYFANVFFQQDRAPPHFARLVRDFLNIKFPDWWISGRGPLKRSLYSLDPIPCDFFPWGYIKSKVYATKPCDLSQFEERIHMTSSEVGEEMLQNVAEVCIRRWLKIVKNGGTHGSIQLVFKALEHDGKSSK